MPTLTNKERVVIGLDSASKQSLKPEDGLIREIAAYKNPDATGVISAYWLRPGTLAIHFNQTSIYIHMEKSDA